MSIKSILSRARTLILSMAVGLIGSSFLQTASAITPAEVASYIGFTPVKVIIVAPNGLPTNTGLSESSPWDLQTAISSPSSAVPPGTVILLRGGTYQGPFISTISGSSTQPIVVRSYPGEWAVINDSTSATLQTAMSSSSSSRITISNSGTWMDPTAVIMGTEEINLTGKQGTSWVPERGDDGTTPTSHAVGTPVQRLGTLLSTSGSHVWWWGFEITSVRSTRVADQEIKGGGLDFGSPGKGNRAINLVIHNVGHPGIGFWNQGQGAEIYGCLIWGNGIYDNGGTWTRGNGVYAQNTAGAILFADNILFRNFTFGLDLYAEDNFANDGSYIGNICFDHPEGNLHVGTTINPVNSIVVRENFTYMRGPQGHLGAGYVAKNNGLLIVAGNYFVGGKGGLGLTEFNNAIITNNTFLTTLTSSSDARLIHLERAGGFSSHNYTINRNTYYSQNDSSVFSYTGAPTVLNFNEWKSRTGYDANSTFSSTLPSSPIVVTRANKYQAKRAHVVVYNFTPATSVAYNLAQAGLKSGDSFVIRDAQNYLGAPVLTGTYTGQTVTLPLNLTTAAPIIGNVTHYQTTHTPKEFNVFVIEGSGGSGTPANTPPTISTIADVSIGVGSSTGNLPFTVGDAETAAGNLTLSGQSSNTTLVPAANITFGGSGASRTVSVRPAANQAGSANITVTVSDGQLSSTTSFLVTVTAANTPPTITSISNVTLSPGSSTGPIPFTVGDAQTAAGSLNVSRSSSNTSLVPTSAIVLGGSGASRTVTVTPAAGVTGSATITLTVSDGSLTANTSFLVTVTAANTPPTITSISNVTLSPGSSTGPIPFTVGDAQTAAGSLNVSRSSSNTSLVPTSAIVLGGSGASRTVTVTPAAGMTGSATITLTVSDGTLTTSTSFTVTVGAPPTGGLVAAYAFNESMGNSVTDASPNRNNGTISGATWAASGKFGGALSFNGSSSWVTVPDSGSLDLTTGMTLAAWVYPTTATGVRDVIVKEGSNVDVYNLYARNWRGLPEGNVLISGFNYTAEGSTLPVNTWTHLAATYDGTTVRLFVNGTQVASSAIAGAMPSSTGPLRIGGNSIWGEHFQGMIDEARVYSRALSQSEIQGIMNTPIAAGAVNTAPTITAISDITTSINTSTQPTSFTIGDAQTPAGSLTLSASSSNPSLIPTSKILFGGSGTSRTVALVPETNQSGTATITITVSDGSLTASTSFQLTVLAPQSAHVVLEAESAALTAPTTVGNDSLASGGKYVSSSITDSGSATFSVNLPLASQYVIWARVISPNAGADSFHVSVDGANEDIFDTAERTWSGQWQWTLVNGRNGGGPLTVNPRVFSLQAGTHQIRFRTREPGTRLDQIVITNDRNFSPPAPPQNLSLISIDSQ